MAVVVVDNETLAVAGVDLGDMVIDSLTARGVREVKVRSVLTCESASVPARCATASDIDITQGLPRVVELFEARTPKGVAPIAEVNGRIKLDEEARVITLVPDDGAEEIEVPYSSRAKLLVADGDSVQVGQQLIFGVIDPKQVLRLLGPRKVQQHLVDEVQRVYRSQGVTIHDKHIEVIVR